MQDLPLQHRMTLPIEWQDEPQVITFQAANTTVIGTVGRDPYVRSCSITWKLLPNQISAWLAALTGPTKRFRYQCPIRGWIVLRATGSITYAEYPVAVECTMSFVRVK